MESMERRHVTDYTILYNNVGLISYGVEGVASESPENRPLRLPHYRLTTRLQGTPANIRISLLSETRVIALHPRR